MKIFAPGLLLMIHQYFYSMSDLIFVYLMKFDIEFMIIKPLRRTHVRIGNG